jgi:stage II sporulation protein GA (sporulation sigma-E factor processing peptidase)
MRVYLDLVVLLNFLVDLLLLMAVDRMAGFPPRLGRSLGAAVLGGLYGGVCLLPGFVFLSNGLWRLVTLGLMGVMAYGLGPGTLRRCALFVLLSMALGGIALAMGTGGVPALVGSSAGILVLCCLAGAGRNGTGMIPLELCYRGTRLQLQALHDTGNTLRDPLTGEPVIVAGPGAARILLDLTAEQLCTPVETVAGSGIPGLRLVPYRAVGRANGMLVAMRFPDARVGGRSCSVLVAFAPEGLEDGTVEALVGGQL